MRTSRWRFVAHGVAAASLCLAAVGCGDDTATNDMAMDMGMRDMTANAGDMADGSMPSAPSGEVVVADVVGTAWQAPTTDGGAETPAPFTHIMLTAAQFPMAGGAPSDFSNLTTNTTTLAISGCVANRYDLTSATGHHPTADVNVGSVTLGAVNKGSTVTTGWEGFRFAAPGPAAQNGVYGLPLPNSATCTVSSTTGFYACDFTGTAPTTPPITAAGLGTTSVAFPPILQSNWNALCTAFAGSAATLCMAACDNTNPALTSAYCEQRLLYTAVPTDGGVSGSTIGFDVPGGAPYTGATKSVNVPGPVYITAIKVGTTAITLTTKTLDDLATHIDKTQDLSISFSCDPNDQGTTGAGCMTGATPFDLVSVIGLTSQHPRSSFSAQSAQFGTLSCIEQQKKADATVTIPAAALQAMLGSQTGGSLELNLVHVRGQLAAISPAQLYVGGVGNYAFLALP